MMMQLTWICLEKLVSGDSATETGSFLESGPDLSIDFDNISIIDG